MCRRTWTECPAWWTAWPHWRTSHALSTQQVLLTACTCSPRCKLISTHAQDLHHSGPRSEALPCWQLSAAALPACQEAHQDAPSSKCPHPGHSEAASHVTSIRPHWCMQTCWTPAQTTWCCPPRCSSRSSRWLPQPCGPAPPTPMTGCVLCLHAYCSCNAGLPWELR